jgi:hypothetical protein
LRDAATELLKQETRPDLRKKLTAFSRDLEIEGTEEEKNRFLAPLERVDPPFEEMDAPRSGDSPPKGEYDKQKSGRPHSEDQA